MRVARRVSCSCQKQPHTQRYWRTWIASPAPAFYQQTRPAPQARCVAFLPCHNSCTISSPTCNEHALHFTVCIPQATVRISRDSDLIDYSVVTAKTCFLVVLRTTSVSQPGAVVCPTEFTCGLDPRDGCWNLTSSPNQVFTLSAAIPSLCACHRALAGLDLTRSISI